MKPKKLIIITLWLLISCNSNAQIETVDFSSYTSFSDENIPSQMKVEYSKDVYSQLFKGMTRLILGSDKNNIKFGRNFRLKLAVARVKNGERIITYSQTKFDEIVKKTNSIEGIRVILAHEIAHILKNHETEGLKPWQIRKNESQADFFAGRIMFKFNISLKDLTEIYFLNYTSNPSRTHPKTDDRLKSVIMGWLSAGYENLMIQSNQFDSAFSKYLAASDSTLIQVFDQYSLSKTQVMSKIKLDQTFSISDLFVFAAHESNDERLIKLANEEFRQQYVSLLQETYGTETKDKLQFPFDVKKFEAKRKQNRDSVSLETIISEEKQRISIGQFNEKFNLDVSTDSYMAGELYGAKFQVIGKGVFEVSGDELVRIGELQIQDEGIQIVIGNETYEIDSNGNLIEYFLNNYIIVGYTFVL